MLSVRSIAYHPSKETNLALATAQIVMGSLLIALCAQISIPLPFTPVPFTLQSLAVMMIGGALGARKGAVSVVLYLLESMLGLPVLAGGAINSLALIGPRGGYLIGFVFQAYLVGWFTERRSEDRRSTFLMGICLASFLQLVVGTLWLGQFVGYKQMFLMGMFPFIPDAIIKISVAVNFLTRKEHLGKS